MTRKGFTLIELLVVVAIIAVRRLTLDQPELRRKVMGENAAQLLRIE